jgi:hypothetical protein
MLKDSISVALTKDLIKNLMKKAEKTGVHGQTSFSSFLKDTSPMQKTGRQRESKISNVPTISPKKGKAQASIKKVTLCGLLHKV